MIGEIGLPLRIYPKVQHYHWGLPCESSLVGRLAGVQEPGKPCAELWLGAHPDLPSEAEVGGDRLPLTDLVKRCPEEMLGSRVTDRFGPALPFLFKILSIAKPLSIQAHPDKVLAADLHREKGYPDDNHKPEMAIALVQSELLFGFRPLQETAADFRRLPELESCLSPETAARLFKGDENVLTDLYRALLTMSPEELKTRSGSLRRRLAGLAGRSSRDEWALRLLEGEFKDGDVGVLSFYVMNLLTLKPGEAVFISANIPHAYLNGELVECMANSDNVVRAGLTPKAKDVETLLAMLRYRAEPPSCVRPAVKNSTRSYRVEQPGLEFAVDLLEGGEEQLAGEGGARIMLCLEGEGELQSPGGAVKISAGSAYIIPAAVRGAALRLTRGKCCMAWVPQS